MDSSTAEQQAQLLTFIRRNCTAFLARALQASSMASSKEPQYIPSSIRSTGGTGTGYSSLPSEYLDLLRETSASLESNQPNFTFSASYPSVNPFSKMPFELPDASLEGELVVGGDPEGVLYPQPHQHIILSHSESARNALIYIAVILAIYLVAVAFIAVQYYQKYQTLDPLTSFILRRSSRRKKDARKHARGKRRRYSSSAGGGGNGGFEAIRSIASLSPTSFRNGSSSNGLIGESQCAPSCSGVRFDQLATVFSENGTTTTTIESNRSDQVNIQINIETVDDEELEEEDNVEEDYYEDEEEGDEEGDEEAPEEEEEEDRFEEDAEMAVFADPEKGGTQPRPKTKRQRLRSLFSRHFYTSHDKAIPGTAQADTTNQNGKVLTRSSSLQATDQPPVPHNPETDSWRPADLDSLKFKRSSIAGFTVAAGTGPLGLFKAHPRHYEETHL